MDDIQLPRGRHESGRVHHRPGPSKPDTKIHSRKTQRHSGETYWLVRSVGKLATSHKHKFLARFKVSGFAKWPSRSILHRLYAVGVACLFIFSTIAAVVQPLIENKPYDITAARSVLP